MAEKSIWNNIKMTVVALLLFGTLLAALRIAEIIRMID